MYVLYSPSNGIKFLQYISLLIVFFLIVLMTVGLFNLIISNTTTQELKLIFSYLLTSMIILFSIGFYMGCRRVFRPDYLISIDDTNLITYQTPKNVVKQFTFSDIDSISEEGPFCFNLKDKSAFYLPFEMENDNIFFEKLFHNYKMEIPNEELFGPLNRKKNWFLTIVIVILLLPFLLIPLLSGNVFVIFVCLIGFGFVFSLMGNTELKRINPGTMKLENISKLRQFQKLISKKLNSVENLWFYPKGVGGINIVVN